MPIEIIIILITEMEMIRMVNAIKIYGFTGAFIHYNNRCYYQDSFSETCFKF